MIVAVNDCFWLRFQPVPDYASMTAVSILPTFLNPKIVAGSVAAMAASHLHTLSVRLQDDDEPTSPPSPKPPRRSKESLAADLGSSQHSEIDVKGRFRANKGGF